ncbi:D-alanine--D-alanine ligase [Clostridium tetani]|nr:D-alanine--D-alanine ligase [Clostridium tetani]
MQIGVVMGGVSTEKEISNLTGKYIIENLDKSKYEILPIPINTKFELIDKIKCLEFAFIALHGNFGEDGKVQALLETMGVPYSGSGVLASSLCMDKNMSKKILQGEGIKTPRWIILYKNEDIDFEGIKNIGYPLVVKPNSGGSSIGITIVRKYEELIKAIEEAFKFDEEILIEEYIKGEEITCCMLDGKPLPILSIKTKEEFFNYKAKYFEGVAEEKVADLSLELKDQVEKISNKCWKSFKLKVYGRIDMIIKGNEVYVIEINTLPGMTKYSLFPKSAKAYGLNFSELLDKIIELSIKEYEF